MALAIMLDLNVAQKFGGEMELWDRLESRADHATMGLIITFLFLLREIAEIEKNNVNYKRFDRPAIHANFTIEDFRSERNIDFLDIRQITRFSCLPKCRLCN